MTDRILVVAAHPDDEALGCGGTISRLAGEGHEVAVMFLTNGVSARGTDNDQERLEAARKASKILGCSIVEHLDFPDNRLDSIALLEVVQSIEKVAANYVPDRVLTHHAGDLNIDHRVCHQAVLTAFRPMEGQTVKSIYGFEVCSSTEWVFSSVPPVFTPQHFIDISDHIDTKMASLDAYHMEMRSHPHSRSLEAVKALAVWRGSMVGSKAAEAFTVIRQVV